MNIHLPPMLMFTRGFLGFDPQPTGFPTGCKRISFLVWAPYPKPGAHLERNLHRGLAEHRAYDVPHQLHLDRCARIRFEPAAPLQSRAAAGTDLVECLTLNCGGNHISVSLPIKPCFVLQSFHFWDRRYFSTKQLNFLQFGQ